MRPKRIFHSVPLPRELIASYENAEYVVFGAAELVLRIGRRDARLERLLAAHGARSAAYVSAANPRGEVRSEEENRAATAALEKTLAARGYACLAGEGRDPEGRWVAEPSLLVLGIAREEAGALGRAWAQNAIVFVEAGAAPELLLLVK
jgi:hypothetical protein